MTNSLIELPKPKFTTEATIVGNAVLSAAASRGFFGVGIFNGKTIENVGTLWRSADLMGAKFIFTIDPPYSAYCRLPGIKEKLGRFDTEEQGMKKIEHAFTYFIKMLEQDETNPLPANP